MDTNQCSTGRGSGDWWPAQSNGQPAPSRQAPPKQFHLFISNFCYYLHIKVTGFVPTNFNNYKGFLIYFGEGYLHFKKIVPICLDTKIYVDS